MENKSDVGNQCLLDGNVGQPFHPSYPNVAKLGLSDFFYSKEWGTTNVGDSGSVPSSRTSTTIDSLSTIVLTSES